MQTDKWLNQVIQESVGLDESLDPIERAERWLVDQRTGIIVGLHEVLLEPNDPDIFCFGARMTDTSYYSPGRCVKQCGGAGLSRQEARAATLGEAIERYSCSIYDREKLICGTYQELSRKYKVLAPSHLPLFHPLQYEVIPYSPFRDDTKLYWTWGYSLVRNTPILVPACIVYLPYRPLPGEETIAPSITTGTACACSKSEALLRGIFEVVERDAFTIMWLGRLPLPHIDLESEDQLAGIFHEKLERPGLRYILIDMTLDIPIPAVFCTIVDEGTKPPMICVGGAAHLDACLAATKALVEAAHTRIWARLLLRAYPNRQFKEDFSDIQDFPDHVLLYARKNMLQAIDFLIDSLSRVVPLRKLQSEIPLDSQQALHKCVQLLAQRGFDVISIDLTPPEIKELGFVVTKVLVPGMQQLEGNHAMRFLGNKRLENVVRALGFREGLISLQEINPYPHPYP